MSKTKTKMPEPKVGLKLLCQQPELSDAVVLGSEYMGEDAEIIGITKHDISVEFKPSPGMTLARPRLNFPAKNMENFWEIFRVKKYQSFCYDRESIWIANDGGGGYYSYESEEACRDYAEKNDEEDSVGEVGRSEREKAAPEMYVLLRRIREIIHTENTKKRKPGEPGFSFCIGQDVNKLFTRIDSALAEAEKDKDLKKIIEFLNIPAPA